MTHHLAAPLFVCLILIAAESSAEATTDTDSAVIQEITVTAQKRTSTVQDTPISIAATSGDELMARGITSFSTLAQTTPGVSLKSEGPSQTEIEMRGMTSSGGNSATVGFYLDDIPLSGPAGAQNGHVVIDPTLYDLNRIEVLRGPQGTLFGSGSMGGTVRLISNQPDLIDFHATAESILSGTEGGGFNHNDNFMLNLPLIGDELALRIVGTENYTSGWIDRSVAQPFPLVGAGGTVRGDVQVAPVRKKYPGSNAYQLYAFRTTLLWIPTDRLSIIPSVFYETSLQNGISAYDSIPGTVLAHYQPFDIAEPLSDRISSFSLNIGYKFDSVDLTSITAFWNRRSTQIEEASENFNNPATGATYAANNGLPNPGYYGPNGSGPESGKEDDPSRQLSEELRFASRGDGRLTWVGGAYFSDFKSVWTFNGTTPNYPAFMDLGTFQRATTPNWFDVYSPTTEKQYAVFGDVTFELTDALKVDVGLRFNKYDYQFSSCISGWGSGLGAAAPSRSGVIQQTPSKTSPKLNLAYTFNPDLMVYVTAANGFRPGGGNSSYPTTGAAWAPAYAMSGFTSGKWPSSYAPDSVWSYEAGEKARFFERQLTVNASVFYEHWSNIQLEAYPNDWALNSNGHYATIYGGEIDTLAVLGAGFSLEVSAGYVHEYLDGGAHWLITPTDKLPDVPTFTADVMLSYLQPLTDRYSLTGRAETSYTGARYSLAFPVPNQVIGAYTQLPGYGLVNLRAGIQSRDGWSATLFVNNVTNKHAQLENLYPENEPSAAYNRIITNQPLTAGIDLTYRF